MLRQAPLGQRPAVRHELDAQPLRDQIHATAFRDARRVHATALCRQSAGGRARRRRARHRRDAGESPASSTIPRRCSCCRRRTAGASRAASHLHAGAGTAVRRPSDGRHRGAAGTAGLQPRWAARLVLEEGVGPVRCELESRRDAACARVRFLIPRLPEESGVAAGEREIAAALSLAPADIGFDRLRPSCWSAGNAVHVRAVDRARRHGACVAGPETSRPRSAPTAPGARVSLLPRDRRDRPPFPCPHVRTDDGYPGGSGNRLGRRGVCRPARPLGRRCRTASMCR